MSDDVSLSFPRQVRRIRQAYTLLRITVKVAEMKEEKNGGVLLLTPKVATLKRYTRNFAGKPPTRSLDATSTAKEKAIPHYLTSSSSSCHDVCKYGRNHTSESNEKGSSVPWRSIKSTPSEKKQIPLNLPSVSAGQKKSARANSVKIVEKSKASEVTVENVPCPEMRKSLAVSVIKGSKRVSAKKGELIDKFKPFQKDSLGGAAITKGSSSLRKKAEISKLIKPSGGRSFSNVEPPGYHRSHLFDLRRPFSYGGSISAKQDAFSLIKKIDFSQKPASSGKSKTEVQDENCRRIKTKCSSALVFPGRFHPEETKQKYLGESKWKEEILHETSSRKYEEEYVDPTKPISCSDQSSTSSPHSCLSSSSPSLSSLSSFSSLSDQEGDYFQGSNCGSASSTTSDSALEHVGDDINKCPTARLTEERRLILGERRSKSSRFNEGEAKKIMFKPTEAVLSGPADPEPETVTLRRQDTRDKKGNMGLFNHVIEETANKLVETRNKVKALVGAFETVISLQEGRSLD